MSNKAAHTKIPWEVCSSRALGDLSFTKQEIVLMPSGNPRYNGSQNIAKCWDRAEVGRNGGLKEAEAQANAELIVTAVNHHQELITRLYNLVNEAKTVMLDLGTFVATDDVPTSGLNLRLTEAEELLSKLIK